MNDKKRTDILAAVPLFSSPFRPFFLAALIYSIISMSLWLWQHLYGWRGSLISPAQWHGYEMIFGYSLAVISGFLLTAVENWSGQKSIRGTALLLLLLLWLIPRIVILADLTLWFALISASLFYLLLLTSFLRPLVKSKDNRQWAIIGKLITLWILDSLFLLAVLQILNPVWLSQILLAAVYTVLALILMMAQRLIPFFTERGIPTTIRKLPYLNVLMLVLFIVFMLADIFRFPYLMLVGGTLTAGAGFTKLLLWHHKGIWSRPLLWVLFLAYAFIIAGIGLKANAFLLGIFPSLPLHLMTYGGIGIMTVGMMARVSLGHTGRDVHSPPPLAAAAFILLALGSLIRVFPPMFLPLSYGSFILISQLLWITAFTLFLAIYAKPLMTARADSRPSQVRNSI